MKRTRGYKRLMTYETLSEGLAMSIHTVRHDRRLKEALNQNNLRYLANYILSHLDNPSISPGKLQ